MEEEASRKHDRGQHAYAVLELQKVLDLVARFTTTPTGAERVRSLRPIDSVEALAREREGLRETSVLLQQREAFGVSAYADPREGFAEAAIAGSVLDASRFLDLVGMLRSASDARRALLARDDVPGLTAMARGIDPLPRLLERLEATFDESGAVRDRASRDLAKIRRELEATRLEIRRQLEKSVRSLAASGALQEAVITIRGGRFVLPVKAVEKSRVPGIVHDESASGATVFVEPMAVVPLNNRAAELARDEAREVRAILAECTEEVRRSREALEEDLRILTDLDALLARSRYGASVGGRLPRLSRDGKIRLVEARHPLLLESEREATVPLELELKGSETTLLLSGPNTGGKTVALKTVGLLSLMAQCGVPVPAGDGSALPIFSSYFAEIGDEQSIEESLSSFSSRLRTVREVLRDADETSLVLLDELGTGTDPEEGGALAGALLRALARRGARTVATTHLGFVMDLVSREEGMTNASMAFDATSGRPTYRVMKGIPGKSHALEIARGLGVDEKVPDDASGLLSEGARRSRELVRELQERLERARRREQELDERERGVADRESTLEQSLSDAARREREMKRRAGESARDLLRRAEQEAAEVLRAIRKLPREAARASRTAEAVSAARAGATRLRRARRSVDRELPAAESVSLPGEEPRDLIAGETVIAGPFGRRGVVIAPPDREGKVEVLVGSVRITLPPSALRRVEASGERSEWDEALAVRRPPAREVALELDLRGRRADEALAELDRYIDSAVLAGLQSVRIIHGKGTGALRREVSAFLQDDQRVQGFRPGTFEEGELGVTVVEMHR